MRPTITRLDDEPRPEAIAVGVLLEHRPPWGYVDRYSAAGWAAIAEGVLRGVDELRATTPPSDVPSAP